MSETTRRELGSLALLLGARSKQLKGASGLNETLRQSLRQRKIPALVAMAATAEKTIYSGALGKRDSASGGDLTNDAIFRIASMTKAVTTTAAMQLVEHGKLKLDEPVAKHLPALADLQVLEGFDKGTGKPILRRAGKPVLLRHLLTHTSGFAYDTWDEKLLKYAKQTGSSAEVPPLVFEPGARWEYGTSIDWTGRLVEAVSGESLEAYFQQHILQPVGMKDTSFVLPPEKFNRLVSSYARQGDGSLKEEGRTQPAVAKSFNGGGGLYSTAGDYVRFLQMILRLGLTSGKERILQEKTVQMMQANQIGGVSAGKLKSFRHDRSSDVDFHPGHTDGFTYGFLINADGYDGRRSAGSLAWAGLLNTFFWIDPGSNLCAVLLMQFLPFCDEAAIGMLGDFERALYRTVRA